MTSDDLLRSVIDNAVLLQVGERVTAIIQARTLRGEYLPGSTSLGYSTKDAPMPYGGLIARIGKGKAAAVFHAIEKDESDDSLIWESSTSGKMWLLLKGGYKRVRELAGKETDRVTMNWSGGMMRALKYKTNATNINVVLYFTNKEAERIASFQHQGAGKNKIKRMFMGLTDKETEGIEKILAEAIAKKFKFDLPAPKP